MKTVVRNKKIVFVILLAIVAVCIFIALSNEADVAYARYEHKQHSWVRNLGSKINDLMAQKLIGKPKSLFLSSFFSMKRYIMIELFGIKNWWKSYLQNMTLIR